MKTKLSLTLLLSFYFCLLSSQIPQGFNYQAIARDGSGNILPNTPLQAMMYVQSLSTGGTIFWKELHSTITTNNFGLFTLVVGTGTRQTESTVATFDLIDWSATPKYLKTEIYYSGSWKDMGTSQLYSVPYALRAKDSEQWLTNGANIYRSTGNVGIGTSAPIGTLGLLTNGGGTYLSLMNTSTGGRDYLLGSTGLGNGQGEGKFVIWDWDASANRFTIDPAGNVGIGTTNPTSKVVIQPPADWSDGTPLFEVRNKTGVPIFSVYNNGVRILVDHSDSKAVKGGFAVGGYDMTKAGKTVDFMTISPDSIRFNINNENSKAVKGGFAVGGYDLTKKGPINQDFMYITPQTSSNGQYNTFLGYQAGYNNQSTGLYNSFIGYNSGYSNTTGTKNVFLGHLAGSNSTNTDNNTFIGDQAGQNAVDIANTGYQGSSNVFIGERAGQNVTTGYRSVLIGMYAGLNWEVGESNIFIGYAAGSGIQGETPTGQYNTFVGIHAGSHLLTGNFNVYLGDRAGASNWHGANSVIIGGLTNYAVSEHDYVNNDVYIGYNAAAKNDGSNNTMIGYEAGTNSTGSNNVFLGNLAGADETGDNKLYIDNSNTASPLIYGDFTDGSELLAFNAKVGIGTPNPSQKLDVFGGGRFSGISTATSGSGVEIDFNAYADNRGRIFTYNRSSSTYYGLRIDGSDVLINALTSGNVGIGTVSPAYKLQVGTAGDGSQARANAWNLLSDANLKTSFTKPNNSLKMIEEINGYYFYWNTGSDKARQFGFSAQEVEKVLPEIVSKGDDGLLSLDYGKVTPLLVEAIKEQQQIIEKQQAQIDKQQQEINNLKSLENQFSELKSLVNNLIINQAAQVKE
ncbi:MAG: tail fiber domain-containing protein [Bacteroidia bacterium]|nr:tail fiber domain-containing protein [Bacteroidia bacterium]